jgi:hypothetical protein
MGLIHVMQVVFLPFNIYLPYYYGLFGLLFSFLFIGLFYYIGINGDD